MDELLSTFSDQILPHWPFVAVVLIFTIIGQFTSKSVFTRERAYRKDKYQFLWWWGRESLSLHPILSALIVGFLWQNPEDADPAWKPIASYFYFGAAGVVSLCAWSVLKGILKKKGIDIDIFPPPPSVPPGPPKELKDYAPVVEDSDIIEDSPNA